ncbi:methyl-accepting chemotaxis protein [Varunaivibrio sulfuroxidans]|uniref:Methyl-accepting chemotaxis protein n=1 Tax=Varunaivibrio sulfuroxidans TaxID=1773489 RepID=A0A4R3JGS0_9PROT|nr:HAMP domain-containing methyl-accepting chemotaxis protein [Varunaivibrio sulfuroxidans]TCS65107.1 methyl-accepting chemotaxis protein [Varunaivibrio sulfuroxidans]WES29606.1 HAMP domain-containing methyl-accepting chemotaxis protein [Varunaivibrio sulfuroxidans]
MMTFSIKQKLIGIGAGSILSLVLLAGIAFFSFFQVKQAEIQNEIRHTQIANVGDMRVAALEIMLAAMDSIIDKDQGTITPERRTIIESNIALLRAKVGPLVRDADTDKERRIAKGIGAKIDGLEKGILGDLQNLIQTKASDAAFAKIDDVLDNNGIAMSEDLAVFATSVKMEVQESSQALRASLNTAERLILIVALISVVVLGGLLFLIGRSITFPLAKMTDAMHRLASGNNKTDIPGVGKKDEIGKMADAVQVFKDNMAKAQRLSEEQAQEQATRAKRAKAIEALTQGFDKDVSGMLGLVSSAVGELQSTAKSMSHTAEETNNRSTTVAAAAEEASTNVQTVASAAEELSSSISEISRQVSQSTQISSTAVAEVEGANKKVQGLAEAANKIGEVVALITDIADQTNLLALNATIEAARAGEAGKGFAVVASEVKNLANQTAKATEEIGAQIGGIQTATQDAVGAIQSIGGIIGEINEIASAIAAAVEEQGAATQEIARNVEQAANGTGEVSSNIAGVTQAAGEAGASSNQVLDASDKLAQQSEQLRVQVDGFLRNIQTA